MASRKEELFSQWKNSTRIRGIFFRSWRTWKRATKFRNVLVDIRNRNEQIIDTVSPDELLFAGPVEKQKEKAQEWVDKFKKFIEANKDELTALQIIYSKPYGQRHFTYKEIKELAEAIKKPPYLLTPEGLWQAYEQLEKSKVKRGGPQKLLTDVVSFLRFAIGESNTLDHSLKQ